MFYKFAALISAIVLMGGIILTASPSSAETGDSPDTGTIKYQVRDCMRLSQSNDPDRVQARAARRIENLARACKFAPDDCEMLDMSNDTLAKARNLYDAGKYSEVLGVIGDFQRNVMQRSNRGQGYRHGNSNGWDSDKPFSRGDGMRNGQGYRQGSHNHRFGYGQGGSDGQNGERGQFGRLSRNGQGYQRGFNGQGNQNRDQWNDRNNPDRYQKRSQKRNGDCDGTRKGKRHGQGRKSGQGKGQGNGNGQGRCRR